MFGNKKKGSNKLPQVKGTMSPKPKNAPMNGLSKGEGGDSQSLSPRNKRPSSPNNY